MYLRLLLSFTCILLATSCETQNAKQPEEKAIKKQSQAFVQAFNKKNPQAIGALFAEDGEYIDPETGLTLQGRQQIEEAYRASFEEKANAQINIQIDHITFPTNQQAIETGKAIITRPGEEPNQTAYKAYYEKQNGTWLLTQIREVTLEQSPSQYQHLKELDWLVGNWIDEDEDTTIETKIHWDKYKNFLTQRFEVSVEGHIELEGMQIIGWDPIQEKIRSWVFDSDGGFGEGVWKKDGESWTVETASTLADGRRASAINIYTPIDATSYRWESTGREVDGELLPNIEPVTVKRKVS